MRRDSFLQCPPERDFHEDDRWTEKDTEIKSHLCSGITASCEDGEKCGALGKWWKASAVLAGYTGTDNDGYGVDAHCPEDIGRRIQLLKTAANE